MNDYSNKIVQYFQSWTTLEKLLFYSMKYHKIVYYRTKIYFMELGIRTSESLKLIGYASLILQPEAILTLPQQHVQSPSKFSSKYQNFCLLY